jgi:hypothetical protein
MNLDEFVAHYGVKGMKWGVRRKRSASADAQRHRGNKKKALKELSDDELKSLVNRLNMEQNARRLNPSKVNAGHNAVKAALAAGVTANAVIAFAASPAGKKMASAFSSAASAAVKPAVKGVVKTLG